MTVNAGETAMSDDFAHDAQEELHTVKVEKVATEDSRKPDHRVTCPRCSEEFNLAGPGVLGHARNFARSTVFAAIFMAAGAAAHYAYTDPDGKIGAALDHVSDAVQAMGNAANEFKPQ